MPRMPVPPKGQQQTGNLRMGSTPDQPKGVQRQDREFLPSFVGERDMKPDAYEISWHRQSLKDNVLDYSPCRAEDGDSEPMFKLSTIRKWLEECSEEMWSIGMNTQGGSNDKYLAMIALKLEELK